MNFKLDSTGDLAIENDNLVMVDGAEEIRQLLIARLQTFYGEWFLDTSVGIPYFEVIFQKGINPSIIYSVFVEAITNTDGVLELEQLDILTETGSRQGQVDIACRVDGGLIKFTMPIGVV